jgi:DNA repair protein SbcC/Rad50
MIPISLSIQGYYSYQKKQIIDFTKLTKAGVFGIFGATGSGKSAIVEAIVYALYGETERINNREDRSYNMMNLQSNELEIEFICFSDYTKTSYKIQVKASRSKQFDKVSKLERTCYKLIDSNWKPISDSIIEQEVTGLSYDNFRRTVIIPQGKFMDFIQLTPTERTQMLKELFDLHKFELADNVKKLESEALSKKSFLEGTLQEIGNINENQIVELEKKELEIKQFGIDLKTKFTELQSKIQTLTILKTDFEELEKLRKKSQELLLEKQKFESIEKQISQIDFCIKNFAPFIDKINLKQNDLRKQNGEKELITEQYNKEIQAFEELEKQFKILEKEHAQLPEFIEHIKQLSMYVESRKNQEQVLVLQQQKESIQENLKQHTLTLENSQKTIETKQTEIVELKKAFGDISLIIKQKQELEAYLFICKNIEICRDERVACDANIKILETKISDILESIQLQPAEKQIIQTIENQIKTSENNIKIIEKEIQNYTLIQEIAQLQQNLIDGEPCPVCGSTEHSINQEHSKALPDFEVLEKQKNDLQSYLKQLFGAKIEIEQIQKLIIENKKKDSEFSKKMHELTIERNITEPDFEILEIDYYNKKIEDFSKQNSIIQELEKAIQNAIQSQKSTMIEIDSIKNSSLKIDASIIEFTTKAKTQIEQINESIPKNYSNKSLEILAETIINREKQAVLTLENYQKTATIFTTKQESIKILKNNILNTENNIKSISEEITLIEKELIFALTNTPFSSKQQIEEILTQKDSLLLLSQQLEKYKFEVESNQTALEKLSTKLKDTQFNSEEFSLLQLQLQESEKQLQESRDEYIRINEQLKSFRISYQKHKDTIQQITECSHELENIYTMKSLFKQSGFVSYMSTRYMQLICDIANKRFSKLTKHSLQLEISENTFCVRDYMNNGKIRHIKTLSGGQAFQAALSLALALSESIQSKSPIISNFFFIDEGFGSQDKESLQIVFETLRSLQNEGKTVGIISHVEDLKENIPIYIQVENLETGSFING